MRLGYTKPELKAERFSDKVNVPTCLQALTDYDKCIYLDLNHSGHYNRGEFMDSSARLTAPNGHYTEVQAYALLRSHDEDSPFTKYDICFSVYNHAYSTSSFTLGGLTKPLYRFLPLDVLNVKIADGRAYFNLT